MKYGSKRRVSKRKQRQYGGELTNVDKVALMNALQEVAFENGEGPLEQSKINDIIAHLETLSEFDSNTESNDIELFIFKISPEVPFKSMEDFDTWLYDNGYSPKNREMEIDNSVLEATSFEDKSKLNGGKKRKQRGGDLTDEDKTKLQRALRAVVFNNEDGPIDEDKINDIIAHLETSPYFKVEEFIVQIEYPFESMAHFDDRIADAESYFPAERQMEREREKEVEKDSNILEATSFEDKSKLNGGKKRKTRRIKKKNRKRKTRRKYG
jgi:hypothetical protein